MGRRWLIASQILLLIGCCSISISALQFEPRQSATIIAKPSSGRRDSSSSKGISLSDATSKAKQATATAVLGSTLAFGALGISALPAPASAVESSKTIQVELNAPVLLKRLKSDKYQRELLDAARELQDVIGPDAVKVTPPSNVGGAFRDLLSGKGEIIVNGQELDVAVLSSEKGSLTIRLANPLLPKIPVLSSMTKIPFLSSDSPSGGAGGGSGGEAQAVAPPAPDIGDVINVAWAIFGPDEDVNFGTLMELLGRAYGWDMTTPFLDQKFFGGKFGIPIPRAVDKGGTYTYVPTNKDVLGSTSLGLGAVYAGSYAYHQATIEEEEEQAKEKKKKAAAKRAKIVDSEAAAEVVMEEADAAAKKAIQAEVEAVQKVGAESDKVEAAAEAKEAFELAKKEVEDFDEARAKEASETKKKRGFFSTIILPWRAL